MEQNQAAARPAKPAAVIAVNCSPAMSGFFATLYDYSWGEGGVNIHGESYAGYWYPEPYETAMGRHSTWEAANAEGAAWAEAEGLEFQPASAERVAAAEASTARMRDRMLLRRKLLDSGVPLREAWDKAKAEYPDPAGE